MSEFSIKARSSAVRLVFYAGHGIQSKGRNYLVPIDADVQSEDEISTKSADVGELVDRLGSIKHGINIVILDAAASTRSRPASSLARTAGASASAAQLRRDWRRSMRPVGTLVAFSTAPNGVALDGANEKHSIYAKHLLANLTTPGVAVEQLFKKVRIGVAEETQRVQVPWESSSLTADFCFKSGASGRCGPTCVRSSNMSDIFIALQIVCLVGLVYGYTRNRRNVMLVSGAMTASGEDFVIGFNEGYNSVSPCKSASPTKDTGAVAGQLRCQRPASADPQ